MDPVQLLVTAVRLFFRVMFWLILIRAVLSWFRPRAYSKLYYDFQTLLYRATEPVLGPIRNFIPPTAMGIDWSPLIALILLSLVENLLVRLLLSFRF